MDGEPEYHQPGEVIEIQGTPPVEDEESDKESNGTLGLAAFALVAVAVVLAPEVLPLLGLTGAGAAEGGGVALTTEVAAEGGAFTADFGFGATGLGVGAVGVGAVGVGAGAVEEGALAPLVEGRAFEAQQLGELGLPKNTAVWRPSAAQMDSAAFRTVVGEPKFTPGGQSVGVIVDSLGPESGLEIKGGSSPLGSSYQLRLMTYRALVENQPLTILTTRPVVQSFFDYLTRWGVTVAAP